MGRGGDVLGGSRLSLLPPQEGAQGAVGAVQSVGGQTQGRRRSTGIGLGLCAHDPTAGDAVVRAQPQPGGKMLGAGPFGHVGADFADHLQRGEAVNSIDPGQVYTSHPVQVCSDVEAGRIALTAPAVPGRRPAVAAVLEPLQLGFNLPVALGNLVVIEPVQFQGLGQLEDVLLPPVSLQRLGDGLLVGPDPTVAEFGQSPGGFRLKLDDDMFADPIAVIQFQTEPG